MSEGFRARDIGLRAQKKILGRMANKNVAKVFIDETTGSLLDNVYKLAKAYVSIFFFLILLFSSKVFSNNIDVVMN